MTRNEFRPYALLILLCACLYLPGLASVPPIDRDESRFAQATRQMIESGDYIRIRFQNEPRHKKPIGIHWLQAAAVEAVGKSSAATIWPYRLPSALGVTLAVLLTFALGKKLFGEREALLGAAVTAASILVMFEAHEARTDGALLAAVVGAQGCLGLLYLRIRSGERTGAGVPFLFWLAVGIGTLIKGPVVPLVSGLTVIALSVADRDIKWIKRLHPISGILLVLLMVLPWAIAVNRATEGTFFTDAFRKDILPKIVSGHESHAFVPGYYLLLLWATFWPGAPFAVPALIASWQRRTRIEDRFLLAWIIPTWVVFELIPNKLPHYVMPTYPALALLTARFVYTGWGELSAWPRLHPGRIAVAAWALMGVLLAAVAVALPWLADGRFNPLSLWPALLSAATATAAIYFTIKGRPATSLTAGVVGAVLILAPLMQFVLPSAQGLWLSRSVAQTVEQYSQRNGGIKVQVAAAGYHEPSLVFLLGTETQLTSPWNAATFLHDHPEGLAVIDNQEAAKFEQKAAELGFSPLLVAAIEGINYSKGRRVTLSLFNNGASSFR